MLISLNKKIFWLVSGLMLTSSLATLLTVWIVTTNYAQKKIVYELGVAVEATENVLRLREQQLLMSSEVLTADFGFKQAVGIGDNLTISSVLENHSRRINADLMIVLTLDGKLLSSSTKSADYDPHVDLHLDVDGVVSAASIHSTLFIDKKLYQVVLVPINAPTPIAIALIGFEIDETFASNISKISGHQVSISASDSSGNTLLLVTPSKPPRGMNWNSTNTTTTEALQSMGDELNTISKEVVLSDRKGVEAVLHLHKNLSGFMYDFYLLMISIGLVNLVLLVAFVLLAGVIARRMTTPLSNLANIAEQVSNENYDHTIVVRSRVREIDSLSTAFSLMQEKIQSREQAIRSQHHYRLRLLEAINSIVVGVNSEDRIAYWNAGAENVFHINAKDAYNQKILSLGISWSWPIIASEILKAVTDNEYSRKFELPVTLPNGEEHIFLATVSPFIEPEDIRSGYLIIADDITLNKRDELRQQQAAKLQSIGQLAAGIAHEINTPSQYVGDNIRFLSDAYKDLSQYISTLENTIKTYAPAEKYNDAIEVSRIEHDIKYISKEIPSAIEQSIDGIERITSIVKAMKDFSHPGSEEKVPVNINTSISSTVMLTKNTWKYVATLNTSFDDSLSRVPCIVDKFNEVILNLIINATDAIDSSSKHTTPSQGLITIESRRCRDYAEVRISDNGDGIPVSIQGQIFNPFFTTKPVGKGTGQGLSICHDIIVEKHHGRLFFETSLEHGTTFFVQLPLEDPEPRVEFT